MRALVISGGGSKGAFAGGVAEHLIKDIGNSLLYLSAKDSLNFLVYVPQFKGVCV